MTKKRAKEILIAHACCMFGDDKMCRECPWRNTEDCKSTSFREVAEEAIFTMKGEKTMKMKLSDIKITSAFADSVPSEKKMEECRRSWNLHNKQDRYLVVTQGGYLIDGYVMYCVLKECGVEEAQVKISAKRKKRWYRKNTRDWTAPHYKNEPTTYIYGVHPNSKDKHEYMWRVPGSWGNWTTNVQIGDTIFCSTKNGCAPVVVNKIEVLDKCPVDFPVKRVSNKRIRRDGMVIE